jgi:hypothetical protein
MQATEVRGGHPQEAFVMRQKIPGYTQEQGRPTGEYQAQSEQGKQRPTVAHQCRDEPLRIVGDKRHGSPPETRLFPG